MEAPASARAPARIPGGSRRTITSTRKPASSRSKHRLPGLLLGFIAVLATLFPLGSAESSAEFDFTSSTMRGAWNLTRGSEETLLLVPGGAGHDRFGWALEAQSIVLNWTVVARYETTRPDDPSPFVFVDKETPRQWNEETNAKRATSQSRSDESNLFLVGASDPGSPSQVEELRFDASPPSWYAGSEQTPTVSGTSGPTTRIVVDVPPEFVQAEANNGTFRFAGNISLTIWDAAVHMSSESDAFVEESGRTHKPVAATVGETEYRLLRIDAVNATLFLQVHTGVAHVAAAALDVVGVGHAVFQGTKGVVDDEGGPRILDREPLTVTGRFSTFFQEGEARVQLTDGRMQYAAATQVEPIVPNATPSWWSPWLWLTLLAIVPLVFLGVRRSRPVTVDDVEWAILSGKSRRGLRLAKRLVGKNPGDPDAVFLYGTTLLARGRFATILKTIEPLSLRIETSSRRGIAFVLAVAAHGSKDPLRARRWAIEAAQDPQLRKRLEHDGVLTTSPSVLQSGYA